MQNRQNIKIQPVLFSGVYQNLSAVCPLILRKVMKKQHNLIIVNCRQMPILRDFLQFAEN